ncbi:ATP-binding protein [Kitasatospora sp. MAP5-34]|uniref:ATP-binding protein n=1 Tax=Kitasatospora sp. MAP5-34 TaxID=3035102 RepID=UPI002474E7EC|nr:ATP-binding protein [Kitasatospora sp. MAP5-34]MDH6574609.1 signal transduction histidine kinase [Kitasatospora sp. MAP5-34]
MLRAGSLPGGRHSVSVLGWLLPVVVTAAAAAVAASVASTGARAGVVWCGVVGTAAVAVVAAEAARRGRTLARLQERYTQQESELRRRLARQEAATVQLAKVALPEAVARLQRGEFTEDVLKAYESHDSVVGPEFQAARQAVLRSVLEAVDAEEGLRESAQRAFVNIARRVQAIVHRQAQDLREMEDRHGNDPAVFDDLLRLDHGNALVGRLADSIAVLGGARPGRQWSRSVPLYSVLRGGISRILDYQRVELHPVSEVAVIGPAAEPLIHALAELLDNATRYSPPQTNVHLTAVEVQTGIAIEIEDGGLSLSEEGRARAERMLKEAQAGIDLNDLGETPRLGLAVVGRLSQAYGFQVSLRPSAYGGVRAVLIVPQELITTAPATGRAHGIGAAPGRRAVPAAGSRPMGGSSSWGPRTVPDSFWSSPGAAPGPGSTDGEPPPNGLPQRRRHATPARTGTPEAPRIPAPAEASEQPGIWLAAFHEGVNGHPPSTGAASGHTSDASAGKSEQ